MEAEDKEGKLYKLTGVIGEITNTTYGNGTLYDKTTGESLTLYGLSGTESALSKSGETWSFENPKDYATTVAGKFEAGDEIVMYGVYEDFNGTPEITGVFDSVSTDKADITYNVTVAEGIENGTVAVSAESGIYGTEITITAAPAADYRVDTVKVNDKVVNPHDGVYKFNILPGDNVVSVSFLGTDVVSKSIELTVDNLGLESQKYSAGSTNLVVDTSTVGISWDELGNYGDGLQWRYKSQKASAIWNTSEMPYIISSIEFNWNTTKTNNVNADLSVTFGTSEITANGTEEEVTFSARDTTDIVECNVEDAKFFRINHGTTSGALYLNSIVINFIVT